MCLLLLPPFQPCKYQVVRPPRQTSLHEGSQLQPHLSFSEFLFKIVTCQLKELHISGYYISVGTVVLSVSPFEMGIITNSKP